MKKLLLIYLFCLPAYLLAQEGEFRSLGKVSYISSQNIYVRFDGVNTIQPGDSLFVFHGGTHQLMFVVQSRSSLSCMGTPEVGIEVKLGQEVYGTITRKKQVPLTEGTIVNPLIADTITVTDEVVEEAPLSPFKEKIRGRASVASYSAFSDMTDSDFLRMRYTFSMQAENISDSRFSTDAYVSFTHRNGEWDRVQDNLFNALKIYNLALKYQPTLKTSIWLGRKVNPNLSNIGAIDGIQFETKLNSISLGAAVGYRPDYKDYGLNTDLFEFGAYLAHEFSTENGSLRNSLAFFEQQNTGKTDRRFVYFQHSNALIRDVYFFLSSELDLYKLENGNSKSTLSLTGFYASIRYRVIRQLSFYASYDARKNVVYYETFKNFADRLLEEATRQGAHLKVNYRPLNDWNFGAGASYRTRDGDIRPAKTIRMFATNSDVPFLDGSVTVSGNLLETSYLNGVAGDVKFFKDLYNGKINSSIGYRYVYYDFYQSEQTLRQHIAELDISWKINSKLSFSVNYEGSFEREGIFHSFYLNLIKRF